MRELLLKRKTAFTIYILACFIPVISQIFSQFTIAYLLGSVESESMQQFYRGLGLGAILIFGGAGLFVLSRMLRIRFMRDTILDVRLKAFDRIMAFDFETFSAKSKEIYISNLVNDVNLFEEHFFHKLLNIIFLGGTYVVSLIILAFLDFKFALVVFLMSLVVYLVASQFEQKTVAMQEKIAENNENFTVDVSNTIHGMEILKLNRVEDPFLEKTLRAVDQVEKQKMFYGAFAEGQRGLSMVLGMISFVGILTYVLFQMQNGMSYYEMSLMIMIANACVWPLQNIVPMINEWKASVNIFNRITHVEEKASSEQGSKPFVFEKEVTLKNVHFQYEDKKVLNHVNLTLEKGKKYLLKGPSGSGKSTLMKLLSKTMSCYEGEILVDGIPLSEIDESAFNHHVSFIYQDVFLFEDTLRNNITLYHDYSDEAIERAIQASGLKEVIDGLPMGLDQPVGENGKTLSGGQRQRISIARAILKETDILFADEATSSLNESLGRDVEQVLLDLDTTVIAISHRHYSGITEKYDYVIEMKEGQVEVHTSEDYFKEVEGL